MSDLHISSPCAADWQAMTPAAAGRHCTECGKDVVDLTCLSSTERGSALKRLELAVAAGRKICVRTPASNAGRIAGSSLQRRVLTGGMATILAVTMAGCQGEGPVTSTPSHSPDTPTQQQPVAVPPAIEPSPGVEAPHVLMGAIASEPPPVELIRMGRIARVDPIATPVAPTPEPSPVMMGEMCVMPPPTPEPTTPEPTTPKPPVTPIK